MVFKIQLCLGREGGVASFTNIAGKVPTLLTSIVWKPLRVENSMLPYELLQNDDFNAGIELSTTV